MCLAHAAFVASRHRSATATSSSTDQCVDVLHLELLWVICFRMRDRAAYEEQPSTSHHPRRPCNPTACPLAGGVPPYQSACPLIEMPHRDAKSTSRDAASRSQARRDPPTAGTAIECPPRCRVSAIQRRLGTTPWPSFLVGQGDVIHFAACFLVELPRRAGSKFTYNVTKDERTIFKENVEANATGIPG